jgi:hypothetical protein
MGDSPDPEDMIRCALRWFHGFHLHRERPKITDWIMVGLTLGAVIGAVVSAFVFYWQLTDARKATRFAGEALRQSTESFRFDERAWIEFQSPTLRSIVPPTP